MEASAKATGENRGPADSANLFHRLSINLFCDYPDIKDLTPEQRYALHQFFHEVLASGYKLLQAVPPAVAMPLIQQKFAAMIASDADPD